MPKIESINLSLSSLCSAKCIFCPHEERGSNVKIKVMSFETVVEIVNQIKLDQEFFSELKKIEISEGGDCFLNVDLIKILRYIRKELPEIHINMFTNFNGLTKDKSKVIVSENLIDNIWVNIDSMDELNYKFIKGLDLKKILNNIDEFGKIRKKYNSELKLNVLILSEERYKILTYNLTKSMPYNYNKSRIGPENQDMIREEIDKIINITTDNVYFSPIIFWAERKNVDLTKIDYNKFNCPQLQRIYKEMFISPSGESYLCCLDNRFDLLVGNVIIEGIKSVWDSEKRLDLIRKLENKQFKEIGYPCNTVNCCVVK